MSDTTIAPSSSHDRPAETAARYVPAYDGLRGIAVAAVVAFHAQWLPGGWAGVDVFFVLSGFLITTNLARESSLRGGVAFGAFYMRRLLRLTPALWALLAAVVLLAPLRHQPAHTLGAVALSAAYVMNWSRAFGWWPDDLLDHTWSLAMEEQFYLLWPLAFVLIRQRRPLIWLTLTWAGVTAWRLYLVRTGAGYERTYSGFDTHADGLLLGCLLALAPLTAVVRKRAVQWAAVPVLSLGLLFTMLRVDTALAQGVGLTLTAGLSAWLIVVAGQPGRIGAALSWPPLAFLGRISYGVYLWHFPIFVLFYSKVPPVAVPLLAAASLGAALLSYAVVERPFLRLKHRFEPKRPAPIRAVAPLDQAA